MIKSNKNLWIIVVIIIVLIIIGIIFFNSQKKEETIKIGFIAPLTGPFAEWAESIKNGVELAKEDTIHKFEIDYQDDACEPKNALNIAQKFFEIDRIKIIIGPGCDGSLQAIAPLAKQNNALLFSTGLLGDNIFKETDNVLNLATQISTEAKVMVYYLKSQNKKRVAIVHGTNLFGEEYGKRLPEFLKSFNINVTVNEPTNLDLNDFRTVILKISKTNPDAIFIHQGEKQVGIFAKQLRESGSKIPVYSYYAIETSATLRTGGNSTENIEYTYPYNGAENSIEKLNFEKRYREKFNRFPTATSFFVYDGIILLDKALDKCSPEDTNCIKNFFINYGVYNGISGEMNFEKDGKNIRPFGIKKIINGSFYWVNKTIGEIK